IGILFSYSKPVFTLFNIYPSSGILLLQISGSARYLITIGRNDEGDFTVDFWLWTFGNEKPDDSFIAEQSCGAPVAICFNPDIEEHIMIVFEARVFLLVWLIGIVGYPECGWCLEDEETSSHVLTECPPTARGQRIDTYQTKLRALIGIVEYPEFGWCLEDEETSSHVLTEYAQKLQGSDNCTLGSSALNPESIKSIQPRKLLLSDKENDKFSSPVIPQIMHQEKIGNLTGGTYIDSCHECYASSSKGCLVIFGNTLYAKPFEEGELDNAKIFRNAVKISPTSIDCCITTDGLLVTGDKRGFIFFFDKRHGPKSDIKMRFSAKLQERIFECDFKDITDDIDVLFRQDLPTDASLEKRMFIVNDAFVATADCNVYAVDCLNDKCKPVFLMADGHVSAIETHEEYNYIIIGYTNGRLSMVDYEKNEIVTQAMLTKSDDPNDSITCLKYSSESMHLMCGRENGEVWILEPVLLTSKTDCPFKQTRNKVVKIKFSSDSSQFAYYFLIKRINDCTSQSFTIKLHVVHVISEFWVKHDGGSNKCKIVSKRLDTAVTHQKDHMGTPPVGYSSEANTIGVLAVGQLPVGGASTIAHTGPPDTNRTVVLFNYNCVTSGWQYKGKVRSHYDNINDIMFMPTNDTSILYTIGNDRYIVEYNNTKTGEEFGIFNRERIEQTAIPMSFIYWFQIIDDKSYGYFVIADNQHKIKFLYQASKVPKTIVLAPAFGCFKHQLIRKMKILPHSDGRYMVFLTNKHIGLHIFPPDGNPYKYVGTLAHPIEVGDFVLSRDGKYVFTFGNDHSVFKWEITPRAVELMHILGGTELEPFYCLIEDGKNGWLFQEIKDLFYYMQILQQESIDLPRRVTDSIRLSELPDLVRTCGFYPTEFEMENMMLDIKYRVFYETQKMNEEINFIDFVKLFCNHKPVYGYSKENLEKAFNTLATPLDQSSNQIITREKFIAFITGTGM
ncbi:hypothetical protein NQ317_013671, partial [Molorchus minor]